MSGEVFLRVDKANDDSNKVAEIKIKIPGSELFAKKQCASFEEATDLAVDALRKQIQKTKKKYEEFSPILSSKSYFKKYLFSFCVKRKL